MGRFKHDEVDHYGGNGGGGFFSIPNDNEVKEVRFMYNDIEDLEGYAVHQVEVDGKKRYVNCLRDYDEPIDKCPFCREHMFQTAKLFIPVYDVKEQKVRVWERGKKFFAKLSGLCSRYPDLVSHVFEVERHGKKGDTQTTYEIYEVDQDDTKLEDLPEVKDIIGGIVLDKTADDMEYYLESGEFPPEENEAPIRRRSSRREESEEEPEERRSNRREATGSRRSERRTPAGRRNREEAF